MMLSLEGSVLEGIFTMAAIEAAYFSPGRIFPQVVCKQFINFKTYSPLHTASHCPMPSVHAKLKQPGTQSHVYRSTLIPGQGGCHLPFMSLNFGPQRFLPHSPPSLWLSRQLD